MCNVNQKWSVRDLAVVGIMCKIATWLIGFIIALLYCKGAAIALILICVIHNLISIPMALYIDKHETLK